MNPRFTVKGLARFCREPVTIGGASFHIMSKGENYA